ncbi:protein of unknown function [Candidatus Bipolaricaulis anaerobius]|uniref:Uncharacterized protein n=1 Tax=Candidatus Bipolaricaulis anaerobius TaxID=2026885 RepID=A0A2X3MIQ9_9BACT|nr:protein of unknown function [Candidatus Bipolaricaulis anaerobius]
MAPQGPRAAHGTNVPKRGFDFFREQSYAPLNCSYRGSNEEVRAAHGQEGQAEAGQAEEVVWAVRSGGRTPRMHVPLQHVGKWRGQGNLPSSFV